MVKIALAFVGLFLMAHQTVHVPVAGNTSVLVLLAVLVFTVCGLSLLILTRVVLRELGLTVAYAGHRNHGRHRRPR